METGKSEITKMPQGKSSEEIDAIMMEGEKEVEQDDSLAQEALEATEEESSPAEESVESEEDETATEETEEKTSEEEKPEVDPKDAVIGDFRRKLRDSELAKARLEGELETRKELQTKAEEPPQKSPLELAEEAWLADEENDDLSGFVMTGELYRKQKAFDDAQAATKTAATKQEQTGTALQQAAESLQEDELSVEKMGEGLDYQTVSNIGDKNLTRGDLIDLANIQAKKGSEAALKESYKIMLRRTLAAGGDDAKTIQDAINTKKGKKSQAKPKPKPKGKTDIDALTTEGEETDTGEAETETHSGRLTNFVFGSD